MMNGNYGWVWNILTQHLICTRLLYGDGVPCLDCKNLAWSQMYVQGQIPASAGYVIMDRALANWVHISNRNGLDDLHAIKLPESRPRNKTSGLCQEVQSECPDAYAGDWRLSTWRSTPGLNSTLPSLPSVPLQVGFKMFQETQDKDVNQGWEIPQWMWAHTELSVL